MRVAVTGRNGQVARALVEIGPQMGFQVVPVGRPEFDLTSPETVLPALKKAEPHAVVNAAAYTAVDGAELHPEAAFATNARGAEAVAHAAEALGVPVLHLSTDYVFDGTAQRPLREDDIVNPVNTYGASKLAGEDLVARASERHAILRTAWVYAPFGGNFVKTMLRLAKDRDEVAVVDDQRGSPTSAFDIARALLTLAPRLAAREVASRSFGTFHLAARGEATWADVAEEIFKISVSLGGPSARVRRIGTDDYPTIARRPARSTLDGTKIAVVHGIRLPIWQESLASCVARLVDGRNEGAQPSNNSAAE